MNASNVTSGTLPVSFGGIGTTTLNNNQILIGNGTNALLQSQNLIWDNSSNGLGIGITQFFNERTSFQVNNRRLWIADGSTPNNSISVLSTDKYGTASTENYIQLIENVGIDFRSNTDGNFNFRCATLQAMSINKTGTFVKNITVSEKATVQNLQVNEDIIAAKFFSSNATSKNLIKFQTKLGSNFP